MGIQVKRDELLRGGAKIIPSSPPKIILHSSQAVVPTPDNSALVVKLSETIAGLSAAQRTETLSAFNALGNQIASALSALKRPEGWNGSWDVHITKRDGLGRISEVQFRPAKP